MIEKRRVKNKMELCLPAISVNEGVARAAVAAFCAQYEERSSALADLKCAVSEAVTNCIVHAYRRYGGNIYITVTATIKKLVISVRDNGCGIEDVAKAREPLFTTDAEHERSGMGFTVMESFTDGLTVRSRKGKGTTVTMTKRLHTTPKE